jgi:MGT family glycosyltransferase
VKVLAYTSPARGHLYPLVPILTELIERGHPASVVTLSGELTQLQAVGIETRAIDPIVERNQITDWRERSPRKAIISALETFAERAARDAADLSNAIEEQEPNVLLVDINCWGAATVAEASGRPWAMYSPYLLPLPSRDAPPFGPGLSPMGGPVGAARDAIIGRVVRGGFDRAAIPAVNALRTHHGLLPVKHFSEFLERPPVLLSLTVEGFDYPRSDWPASVRLVGPINWAPPEHEPEWLAALPDPLVLVTCSTELQDDEGLIALALEALPPTGFGVVGTTAAHDPASFNPPPGSRIVRFLAHEHALRRAACVVCHGGLGITQKALAAGVPVVVVPHGRDQLETARRVEVANVGVRLSPRRLNPVRLADAVHKAVTQRPEAELLSQAYALAGGASAAAAAIEKLARVAARRVDATR